MNKNSPLPIYYQLKKAIKEWIEKKELVPGDVIPSERQFAEMYSISRMTVRQAINHLVNEGYLIRKRGKGTFVADREREKTMKMKGLKSFSEDMRQRGLQPEAKVLEFKVLPAEPLSAQKLQIEEYAPIYKVITIRSADQEPMAFETSYMPVSLMPTLTKETVETSVYEYLEKTLMLRIDGASQTLEAAPAKKKVAEMLKIEENDPVLLVKRVSYLEDGRPFEFVDSVYRGDRYQFCTELIRV
ncbi:MAG: GntR family transcriptional regulator [Bacillales bacterium]|nr:GntR family transcriptional regulator [Bacillales bacterium]